MQQNSIIPTMKCPRPGDEKAKPDDYNELRWLDRMGWLEAILNDIGLQADRDDFDGWRKTAEEIKALCYYSEGFDIAAQWSTENDDFRPVIALTLKKIGGAKVLYQFTGPHRYVQRPMN